MGIYCIDTVSTNKVYRIDAVSTNKIYRIETVSTNKIYRIDTVSTNKIYRIDKVSTNFIQLHLKQLSKMIFGIQLYHTKTRTNIKQWCEAPDL